MTLSWTGPGGVLYETAPVGVITLTSEAASVIWGAFKFNLGHTPGYESVEVKKLHQIKVLLLVWASVDFKPEVLTAFALFTVPLADVQRPRAITQCT